MTVRWFRRFAALGVLAAPVMSGWLFTAPFARADAFGELRQVGEFGTGTGQFKWPHDVVVNPEDNSVFVLDNPEGSSPATPPPKNYRVQRFGPGLGAPEAIAMIPTPEAEKYVVDELAIDSSLHRLYALESVKTGRESPTVKEYVGYKIMAYNTEPVEVAGKKTLALASTVETGGQKGAFYEFPLPGPGSTAVTPPGALDSADGIAVDPITHNLIVIGGTDGERSKIQQIVTSGPSFSSGKLGESFEDTKQELAQELVSSVAIGRLSSGGTAIYLSGKRTSHKNAAVVKLSIEPPNSLAKPAITPVHEDTQLAPPPPLLTGGYASYSSAEEGTQLAVSPAGDVVYAPEWTLEEGFASPHTAGSYEIRGMSTANGSQLSVFGGGTKGCLIASANIAVAAGSNGIVYALDEGEWESASPEHTSFGFHLIEFGPGGKNGPAPVAAFSVAGSAGTGKTTVEKGKEVTLEASEEELHGEKAEKLVWEITGPATPFKAESIAGSGKPASLSVKHPFLKPGLYTATLTMTVSPASFGQPAPLTRQIEVTAPPPTASFEASTATPKAGETVTLNASGSLDPTGSATGGPTHKLKSYTWSFGDGSPEVTTTSETVTHAFANPSSQPLSDTVTLTVTNEEEVKSTPTTQTLTIQGTPAEQKEPAKEPVKEVPPVTTTTPDAPPPPPAQKPLTRAQKLAKALKACRKYKSKRARARCEKAAKKKYAAKPKKTTKK